MSQAEVESNRLPGWQPIEWYGDQVIKDVVIHTCWDVMTRVYKSLPQWTQGKKKWIQVSNFLSSNWGIYIPSLEIKHHAAEITKILATYDGSDFDATIKKAELLKQHPIIAEFGVGAAAAAGSVIGERGLLTELKTVNRQLAVINSNLENLCQLGRVAVGANGVAYNSGSRKTAASKAAAAIRVLNQRNPNLSSGVSPSIIYEEEVESADEEGEESAQDTNLAMEVEKTGQAAARAVQAEDEKENVPLLPTRSAPVDICKPLVPSVATDPRQLKAAQQRRQRSAIEDEVDSVNAEAKSKQKKTRTQITAAK